MRNPSGVSGLIKQAEEHKIREASRAALTPELSMAQLLEGLKAQVTSKVWWLEQFSSGPRKRPDTEINARRHELAVLVQAAKRLKHGGANEGTASK